MNSQSKMLILFDGMCNFCNFWAGFLGKRNKSNVFHILPLQSAEAKDLIISHPDVNQGENSIIVIFKEREFQKSKAVFTILKVLGFPWNLLLIFNWLPESLTDAFYDLIAQNRYRIFGKRAQCVLPDTYRNSSQK